MNATTTLIHNSVMVAMVVAFFRRSSSVHSKIVTATTAAKDEIFANIFKCRDIALGISGTNSDTKTRGKQIRVPIDRTSPYSVKNTTKLAVAN